MKKHLQTVYLFCLTLLLVGFTGCSNLKGTHTYVVKVGKHEMKGNRVRGISQNSFSFNVKTDDSWIWDVPEKNGFSKVTGIRWIKSTKENSVRLVYINKPNGVHEFWSYIYINGVSPQENKEYKKKLIDVKIGKTYTGKVGHVDGFYYVEIGGEHHSIEATGEGAAFLNFPYIGGTYTIDHDWTVTITYLKNGLIN